MNFNLLVGCIFFSIGSHAQIINNYAGNGAMGDSGDGELATVASLSHPFACAFDSRGNFYFTEVGGNKVRVINTAGVISDYAGGGMTLGDGGPATAAQFEDPTGIAIDEFDNVYIIDVYENRLRKIDAITNIISTIAGNGAAGYGGDGAAASTSILHNPNNICFDGFGNLYIADGSNRIRKISTAGIITTVVGNGTAGYSGDGGMATAAEIEDLLGICFDANNNLFFGQLDHNYIRMVSPSGIITTIAGNGSSSINTGDGGPATAAGLVPYELTFDKEGNLYVTGYIANIIRKIDKYGIIYTVAGNGVAAWGGDGGPATASELFTPIGIATDSCGNLYVTDRDDNHIRKVSFNPMCLNLGINNQNVGQPITIYPNPTYDQLNLDNLKTPSTYRLLNILGTIEQQGKLKEGNNSIPMQELTKGMYLLEITDDEGNKTVKKIMKE